MVTLRVSAATGFCSAFVLIGAVSTAGAPPRVQARIVTPGQPIGVAYAGGSAWVTSFDRNAVLRIDQATNKVAAVVPVGQGPIGVVAGAGAVWVADWSGGAVTRIDPATNRATATIPVGPSEGPEGMAFGAGAVWISHKEGAVTRIDPESNSIVARIPVDREARYLAVGDGAVWVTSFDLGTVQRIDPATNRVVKTIRLGFLSGPQGVAVRGSTVWVVTNATGSSSGSTPGRTASPPGSSFQAFRGPKVP